MTDLTKNNASLPCTTSIEIPSLIHNKNLFQVVGGISAEEALGVASVYLASAIDLGVNGSLDECRDGAYSVPYLIELAKALIDSVCVSLERGRL